MVNKQFNNVVITDSITDPSGAEHTGLLGEGGGSGASWIINGTVSANDDALLKIDSLTADQTQSVLSVTAIRSDGTALPSNVDMFIGPIDSGGTFTFDTTIVSGNGSTRHIDVDSDVSYSPSSDSAVAIVLRNDRTTAVDMYTTGTVEIA